MIKSLSKPDLAPKLFARHWYSSENNKNRNEKPCCAHLVWANLKPRKTVIIFIYLIVCLVKRQNKYFTKKWEKVVFASNKNPLKDFILNWSLNNNLSSAASIWCNLSNVILTNLFVFP